MTETALREDRLELHSLTEPDQAYDLISALSGRRCQQVRHIAAYLRQLGVRSLVVQRDVQDPDFLAEHAAYYARWAFPVPRFCQRLHFFSVPPESADVLEALDYWAGMETSPYLGFLTLRPVAQSPVGATFLHRPDGPVSAFVHTHDRYPVHLAGRTFEVPATPFMQQDNAVGACAQASIWMALRTLRWREGRSPFSPAAITEAATRFMVQGRVLPNRDGLRIEQIAEAIRSAGYASHVVRLRNRPGTQWETGELQGMVRKLYPYIESGIPVLLALQKPEGGHAVMILGHGWSPDGRTDAQGEMVGPWSLLDASQWARPFLIHNDNTGPYLTLPEGPETSYSLADAFCAIPLMSADILIDAEEAQQTGRMILERLTRDEGLYASLEPSRTLVERVRLRSRANIREAALGLRHDSQWARYLRLKWFPAHVWSLEFYAADDYAEASRSRRDCLAEVLLEPGAEPEAGHFLTVRINGALLQGRSSTDELVIDRDAFTGSLRFELFTR